jgi:hypothetical protein
MPPLRHLLSSCSRWAFTHLSELAYPRYRTCPLCIIVRVLSHQIVHVLVPVSNCSCACLGIPASCYHTTCSNGFPDLPSLWQFFVIHPHSLCKCRPLSCNRMIASDLHPSPYHALPSPSSFATILFLALQSALLMYMPHKLAKRPAPQSAATSWACNELFIYLFSGAVKCRLTCQVRRMLVLVPLPLL